MCCRWIDCDGDTKKIEGLGEKADGGSNISESGGLYMMEQEIHKDVADGEFHEM